MMFMKRLRAGVRRGEITCSVRIWTRPHVKPGNRYPMEEGAIVVESIEQITLADITPKLARESGFAGVVDLLKTAKHGAGTNVYLVRFHYSAPPEAGQKRSRGRAAQNTGKTPNGERQRERIARLLTHLPEARAVPRGTHWSLEVRTKRFGYFLVDHHGDGRIALQCKSSADVYDAVRQLAPDHFHVPKYVGNKGWIGMWLDRPKLDWSVVALVLREAYSLTAPKKLSLQLMAARPLRERGVSPGRADARLGGQRSNARSTRSTRASS